jgi:hypothetical protein
MNGITKYFKSPKNEDSIVVPVDEKPSTPSRKAKKIDILHNMEKVIKSVKKKHKHRRRKSEHSSANDVQESDINDISAILNSNLSLISPNVSLDSSQSTGE